MRLKKEYSNILFRILLSIMTTLSLTMKFGIPDYTNVDLTFNKEFLVNIRSSLFPDSFITTFIFVLILWFSVKIEQMNQDKIKVNTWKAFYGLCMAIGFVWLMAKSFEINNGVSNIYETKGQIIKSVIYYIGTVNLLVLFGKLIFFILADCSKLKFRFCEYSDLEIRRSKYGTFAFLMIMWMPHLVMAYPASVISDAWTQLKMFYGKSTFTMHHPPFHTWLIGMAVQFGKKVGSANVGLFLFVLLQSIIFALVLSYGITTMKRLNSPRWLIVLTKFIAVISPYYTAYIGLITKDTLYSYFFLLFMIELVYLLCILGRDYWKSRRHMVLLILSSVSVILFRNNGKYIIYPMLIIIFILMIKNGVLKSGRENIVRVESCLCLIILIPILINLFLIKTYEIEKGSIKEMLSLPFQQTARYIVTYGDEVTDEERQGIDQILDYDSLAEYYNPILSDPVKSTFRKDSTSKELIGYFEVWLRQFAKHPMTYIIATVNQNYKLLYPAQTEYSTGLFLETYDSGFSEFIESLEVEEISLMNKGEDNLRNFYVIMFNTPITGFFSMIAVYNLVLFYILVYAAYKKLYSIWIVAIPLLISDLVIIAGPIVQPRYALPIVYSIPIVVAFFLYSNRKGIKKIIDI